MLFVELLQVALNNRSCLSVVPTDEEWNELFSLAEKQTLIGIVFLGIQRLPKSQQPTKKMLVRWYMLSEKIKKKSTEAYALAASVVEKFREEGFRSVILKGQGMAMLYADGDYRMSGDIDIWLEGSRHKIVNYVRSFIPHSEAVYHHIEFPIVREVEIEVHFTPSWMNSPITNARLQRFFRHVAEQQFEHSISVPSGQGEIPVPTLAFNRIFILVHIYRHLFHEGIGLRQLLDYYYVLRAGFSEEERKQTLYVLKQLKMIRFTSAVMYVMREVFALEENYLLVSPDEKEGAFLLDEIMSAGNMGKYDERLNRDGNVKDWQWGIKKMQRNTKFLISYPSEVLWSPIFKLWHWGWRMWWNR